MSKTLLLEFNYETEVLTEGAGDKKNFYIKGIFMQADTNNHNRRNYPLNIMEAAVNNYDKNFVKTKRAIGELLHPSSVAVNPERASHLVEEITKDGKNFIGKAKVLNTPCGNIVRGLLEGGVVLGVSSRGTGSVVPNNGIDLVQSDFNLSAIDVVYSPSAPDALVQGIMEGHEFVWNTLKEDVRFVEQIKAEVKAAKKNNLEEAKIKAFNDLMKLLKG